MLSRCGQLALKFLLEVLVELAHAGIAVELSQPFQEFPLGRMPFVGIERPHILVLARVIDEIEYFALRLF